MIAAHASPQSSAEHAEGPKHAADACHEEQHTWYRTDATTASPTGGRSHTDHWHCNYSAEPPCRIDDNKDSRSTVLGLMFGSGHF